MKQLIIFTITVVIILLINVSSAKRKATTSSRTSIQRGCKITLPKDIPENEPVYLLENRTVLNIFTPTGKDNFIKRNSYITLFCPGNRNSLTIGDGNRTQIKCNSNLKFEIDGIEQDFSVLNCTKETAGNIQITRQKCANDRGGINEIGFQLDRIKFIPLFEVCYRNDTGSVIYSKHKINGQAIKFNVKEGERRDFKTTGIPRSITPNTSYKKTKQIEHFNQILGFNQIYINTTSFLSRGHMTPDADFIFTTAQFATYFYVNVAPQFQTVNAGNWLKVEVMARNLSITYNSQLLIYTGSYQQLELPDSRGENIRLWLESDEKIEIPKWLWKVIIDERTDSAIVMITLNNPFARKQDVVEFCTNVCSHAGLDSNNFDRMHKGYTFCCELEDFKRAVHVLPDNVTARNLLGCSSISFH